MTPNRLKTILLAACCGAVLAAPPGAIAATETAAPASTPIVKCVGADCLKTNLRKSKDQIEPGDRAGHPQVKPVGEHGGAKQVPVETAPADHH